MRLDLPDEGGGGGEPFMPVRNRILPENHNREVERIWEEENIAGYVLYRRKENNLIEYLLLKKIDYMSDWTPPKGHVEIGEDTCDGAEREIFEETGLVLGDYEALEQYPIYFEYKTSHQILKRVHLWAAKFLNTGKPIRLSPEHDEFKWLDYEATLAVIKQPYKEAMMAADLVIRTYESI